MSEAQAVCRPEAAVTEPRSIVLLKRAFALVLAVLLVVGMISAYRAWFQVKSLDLHATDLVLRSGSSIQATVVTYARTQVDVRVELVQGAHSETLAVEHVPKNEWAFFDPRTRSASQTAVLTQDVLGRFGPGRAQVRATAIGRPQWMRLPPPVVRELAVEIPPH